MFPAISSTVWYERRAGVGPIRTQPQSVRLAIRGWAAAYLPAALRDDHVELDSLRRIIAAVDRYVWRSEYEAGNGGKSLRLHNRPDTTGQPTDTYACGHSERVARFATRLAEEFHWNPLRLTNIYVAGLLHDVGKVGVDAEILHKPGGLTEREYGLIKLHPELGAALLAGIEPLADALPAVLHHHERWDGRGYPSGLVGDQIPRIARIVAVADAFDAMTSDRPYRHGMSLDDVQRVFDAGADVYWDPQVIDAYDRARDDLHQIGQVARRA
jgi:HD-GYP domain-containing protein (c-di-GMP phosphodiesterase class II)